VTRHDIPLIFTNHTRYDLYSDSYAPFIPHNIRYGALRAALAWFLDHCSLVIAPSQSIAQWLTEFALYEDATAIPNGIDVTMFESPSALTRSDIGLDEDAFIFCYTGRIAPEKNTLYLLDELRQACQTAPSIQLLIVGDGPDHDCFLQYVEENGLVDRVICAGMIPYEDISSYEQLADAFVTGSISEVHPLVVLEAMAARLPVIAIDSPGIRETVMHNVNGLIAPQVEPGALAELMIRIAQDDSLCERLAQGARETIGHFTLEKTAGRVLDEYERLRVS
jgi:glycosyltransferase involved in cell wall biosynthesis